MEAGTFTVVGSCGRMVCNAQTGAVLRVIYVDGGLPVTPEDAAYDCLARADVAEWHAHYNGRGDVLEGRTLDVLDLGWHCVDGAYEPPCADHRADVARSLAA